MIQRSNGNQGKKVIGILTLILLVWVGYVIGKDIALRENRAETNARLFIENNTSKEDQDG